LWYNIRYRQRRPIVNRINKEINMKDEVIIKATKETTKETIESIVIKQGVTFGEFKKEYGNDEKLKKDEVRDEVIGVVLRAALDSNDIH